MRTTDRRSVKILNLSHNFTSAQGLSLKNDDLVSGKLVKFSNHSLASSCHFISSRGICWKKKEKVNSRYLVISTLCESYPCCLYFPYTRQLVNILNNKDVRKMKVFCFEPQTEFSSCRLHTQSCLRLFSEFKGVTKISWKQISHLKWSFLHKQIMSSFIRRKCASGQAIQWKLNFMRGKFPCDRQPKHFKWGKANKVRVSRLSIFILSSSIFTSPKAPNSDTGGAAKMMTKARTEKEKWIFPHFNEIK